MKIAVIIVRVLLGLLFLMASVVVLFKIAPEPELKGNAKLFMQGVAATVYLMPFIKITELVCSLAFISGRFVPLATVVIFPVTLNIVLYNAFVSPEALPIGIFVLAANLFLAYAHREKYKPFLVAK